jgi:hypothetical protein
MRKQIYVADIETVKGFDMKAKKDYLLKPYFMCVQNMETENFEKTLFFNDNSVSNFINRKVDIKNPSLIYFHNLDFDLKYIFELLPISYETEIISIGGKIAKIRLYKTYKRNYCICKIKKHRKIHIPLIDGKRQKCKLCNSIKNVIIPTYTKTAIELRDSLIILLTSVERIGKALRLEKMKIDYDENSLEAYIEYCKQDCRIVTIALKNLCKMYNNTFNRDENNNPIEENNDISFRNLPLTLPALSKRGWFLLTKRKFGYKEVDNFFRVEDFLTELMRNFYFGGRVEVFNFNICRNGAYNDYNSFYPKQMFHFDFPIPPYKIKKVSNPNHIYQIRLDKKIFGAICEIEENQNIPLIPIRYDNKILFVNGKKVCFLFRDEIEYLLKHKVKILVNRFIFCKKYLPIFREFIEKTYFQRKKLKETVLCLDCKKEFPKRLENKEIASFCVYCNSENIFYLEDGYFAYFLKIMMNSLYGKFAEKETKEDIRFFAKLKDTIPFLISKRLLLENSSLAEKNKVFQTYLTHTDYGKRRLIKFTGSHTIKSKINIFFSMLITAMSRLQLHKDLIKGGKNLTYCDTDSIVLDKVIEDSDELGGLKPEFFFKEFQPLSCKEYAVIIDKDKRKTKMKGFSNRIQSVKQKKENKIVKNTIKNFCSDYLKPKMQFRPTKLKETLNRRLHPHTVVVFPKTKRSFYDKRWINEDFTTKPFNIDLDNFEDLKSNNRKMILKLINLRSNMINNYLTNPKLEKFVDNFDFSDENIEKLLKRID